MHLCLRVRMIHLHHSAHRIGAMTEIAHSPLSVLAIVAKITLIVNGDEDKL